MAHQSAKFQALPIQPSHSGAWSQSVPDRPTVSTFYPTCDGLSHRLPPNFPWIIFMFISASQGLEIMVLYFFHFFHFDHHFFGLKIIIPFLSPLSFFIIFVIPVFPPFGIFIFPPFGIFMFPPFGIFIYSPRSWHRNPGKFNMKVNHFQGKQTWISTCFLCFLLDGSDLVGLVARECSMNDPHPHLHLGYSGYTVYAHFGNFYQGSAGLINPIDSLCKTQTLRDSGVQSHAWP